MRVDELAVVVDLAGEVRVVLVGRFEDDLLQVSDHYTSVRVVSPWTHL